MHKNETSDQNVMQIMAKYKIRSIAIVIQKLFVLHFLSTSTIAYLGNW